MSVRLTFKILIPSLIAFMLAAAGKAQSSTGSALLCREWVLEQGWFPDDTVSFRSQKRNDSKHIYSTVQFLENGNLTYELHAPKDVGLCGNGLLHLDEASWKPNDEQRLTMHLKGGRIAESKFEYKIIYQVRELSKSRMVLVKEKLLLQKETYE